jgi:hypothetical protein
MIRLYEEQVKEASAEMMKAETRRSVAVHHVNQCLKNLDFLKTELQKYKMKLVEEVMRDEG